MQQNVINVYIYIYRTHWTAASRSTDCLSSIGPLMDIESNSGGTDPGEAVTRPHSDMTAELHTILAHCFNSHLPSEPALASCSINFPSPLVLVLFIIPGTVQIFSHYKHQFSHSFCEQLLSSAECFSHCSLEPVECFLFQLVVIADYIQTLLVDTYRLYSLMLFSYRL